MSLGLRILNYQKISFMIEPVFSTFRARRHGAPNDNFWVRVLVFVNLCDSYRRLDPAFCRPNVGYRWLELPSGLPKTDLAYAQMAFSLFWLI